MTFFFETNPAREKLGPLCLNLMGISPELLEDLYLESAEAIGRKAI